MNQDDTVRRDMEALFQYYNDYHPDSVLFIALYVVGKNFLSDAEITDFSNDSVTFLIEQEGRKDEIVHKLNRTVNCETYPKVFINYCNAHGRAQESQCHSPVQRRPRIKQPI